MDTHSFIKLPRLYVDAELAKDATVFLPPEQAHYLKNVIRRKPGDNVRLFNGRSGEWRASLHTLDKKGAQLLCTECLKPQGERGNAIHLLFAPIKKARQDELIEKATELGVTDFHPVLTQNTEVRDIKRERIERQIIEASEQCERLDVPALHDCTPLFDVLAGWKTTGCILACIERESDTKALLDQAALLREDCAFIVGPEGGFTAEEKQRLCEQNIITPVSLGDTVLRAETASLYVLAAIRLLRG